MTTNDMVARRTINLMREKHLSQYRLEIKSGIPHGAMARILNGKNKTITLTTLYKLSFGLDMTINEFIDNEIFKNFDKDLL